MPIPKDDLLAQQYRMMGIFAARAEMTRDRYPIYTPDWRMWQERVFWYNEIRGMISALGEGKTYDFD